LKTNLSDARTAENQENRGETNFEDTELPINNASILDLIQKLIALELPFTSFVSHRIHHNSGPGLFGLLPVTEKGRR
jgi:hypothetical protein